MDIGKRVKYFREAKNISGRTLALKTGLDPSQINKIEHGVNKPSLDSLERICQVLGITLSEFFSDGFSDMPPELIRITNAARELTPKQRKALQQFLDTLIE